MKRLISVLLCCQAFLTMHLMADTVKGVVKDVNGVAVAYPTLTVQSHSFGVLGNAKGEYALTQSGLADTDTIKVTSPGYQSKKVLMRDLRNGETNIIVLNANNSPNSTYSGKVEGLKRKLFGKKSSRGLFKTVFNNVKAGSGFGYEVQSPKDKEMLLNSVGFYFKPGDMQLEKMNFRINVYDMSKVDGDMSDKFIYALSEPVYFDFDLSKAENSKYEFKLKNPIKLPQRALVEVELLNDMGDSMLWFRSNIKGTPMWTRNVERNEWSKVPFASPFFVECAEL